MEKIDRSIPVNIDPVETTATWDEEDKVVRMWSNDARIIRRIVEWMPQCVRSHRLHGSSSERYIDAAIPMDSVFGFQTCIRAKAKVKRDKPKGQMPPEFIAYQEQRKLERAKKTESVTATDSESVSPDLAGKAASITENSTMSA